MSPETQILIVDDEQDLVWAVQYSLRDEGYETLVAQDGVEALDILESHHPDLVILDIVLPRLDGFRVCRELRRNPILAATPILFLTARNTIEDRITGLDEGGDDYLTKPFDLRELKARVRALLRRTRPSAAQSQRPESRASSLSVGELTLEVQTRRMRVGAKTVQLTPSEFTLFHYLMIHPGQLLSSQHLAGQALGYSDVLSDSSLVRWHIRNLRSKIEPDPVHPIYICTVPHHGYILEDHSPSAA